MQCVVTSGKYFYNRLNLLPVGRIGLDSERCPDALGCKINDRCDYRLVQEGDSTFERLPHVRKVHVYGVIIGIDW
jgi:hypothetical protein